MRLTLWLCHHRCAGLRLRVDGSLCCFTELLPADGGMLPLLLRRFECNKPKATPGLSKICYLSTPVFTQCCPRFAVQLSATAPPADDGLPHLFLMDSDSMDFDEGDDADLDMPPLLLPPPRKRAKRSSVGVGRGAGGVPDTTMPAPAGAAGARAKASAKSFKQGDRVRFVGGQTGAGAFGVGAVGMLMPPMISG